MDALGHVGYPLPHRFSVETFSFVSPLPDCFYKTSEKPFALKSNVGPAPLVLLHLFLPLSLFNVVVIRILPRIPEQEKQCWLIISVLLNESED